MAGEKFLSINTNAFSDYTLKDFKNAKNENYSFLNP